MNTLDLFVELASIRSDSCEESDVTPSTPQQFDVTGALEKIMTEMGLSDVYSDDHAYVYGRLPATPGCESAKKAAFIAHIDTVAIAPNGVVRPRVIENYDGKDVVLGDSGKVLTNAMFPHLSLLAGQTLIVTDGTTCLGSDDKSGVVASLIAAQNIMQSGVPHGEVEFCFCPDEEIGHGAALMDLERLGADFGYTVDGGELNEINYETFNASAARWEITGVSVHPGSSKDTMINASLVAMEINSMLPAAEIPARTENYEGFFHLCDMKGDVEKAELSYIIRDHDAAGFAQREKTMQHIEKIINEKYGEGTAKLTIKEQYRNMAETLKDCMFIIDLADNAISKAGLNPVHGPIRGGTDGAQLSYRGLPCPNIGTGGYACHGPYEHVTVERMDKAAEIISNIIVSLAE